MATLPFALALACPLLYGSDPTEGAFSGTENILRKLGARTHEALLEAMDRALSKVTPADAAGWFDHCHQEIEAQYL